MPHKHVAAIHRVGESKEWLWLVLEYVSGGTLKERLIEPLPSRDAARLTETIALAVGFFHTRGVVHLDLKPSNILLDGERGAPWEFVSPKISDFGIARLEGEPGTTATGANGPKGTPSYMAPEQIAALPGTIGPSADIHALGSLLYHLLTGRPPFQGASSVETFDQVRNQEPVPPRRLNGRIPRDLETICLKCLEKSPGRRYWTAEALADDLRLWLDGHPIKARRVSPMGNAWRLCRRHPAVATLVFALTITLSTGVVGLFVLLDQVATERIRLAKANRHAKTHEQFSASAADQLVSFLRTTIRLDRNTTRDQMTSALLRLRSSTSELRNQGIVPSTTIGILEEEIGWALVSFNKIDEGRDLLRQAISDLQQSSAKNPENNEVRLHLEDALLLSGDLAEGAGQLEDALDCFEQVANIRTASEPMAANFDMLTGLHIRLRGLAQRCGRDGLTGPERRSRHLDQRILRHLMGPEFADLTTATSPGMEAVGRLLQRDELKAMTSHEDSGIRLAYEHFVCQWLALSVESLSPFHSSAVATDYDRDPEAGAVALISALREQCRKLGLADSLVPAAGFVLAQDATGVAGQQRNLGRLDDARATAARLMTLAQRLVRDYPDHASSYRVLSESYNHIKKNAIRSQNEQYAEAALGQAIQAAKKALALAPDRIETRRHLDNLTGKFANTWAHPIAKGP